MIHLDKRVKFDFPDRILKQAALAALGHSGAADGDLTIVVTTDEEIQRLNKEYLDTGSPTDVLSFPAGEVDPETERPYLGDVIISLPRAREQALTRGCAVEDEICLLVVHGVLHLLGYDHADEGEKNRMWKVQAEILNQLGSALDVLEE